MRKLVIGLMVAAAFAFVSYNSFANCGKCGNKEHKCNMQSSAPACNTMDGKPCCDMCAKGECCKMSGGKPCCNMCAKGECCKMSGGKPCCDMCAKAGCATKGAACPEGCDCKCCAKKKACNKPCKTGDPTTQDFAPDPVCGMDIETKDAKFTYEYEGKTYYFCCESCKERFSKDPSKFLGK